MISSYHLIPLNEIGLYVLVRDNKFVCLFNFSDLARLAREIQKYVESD